MSTNRSACATLTYSAFRPVSGCVRTTGCAASYNVFASSRLPSRTRSSRVRDTSALADDEMHTSPSNSRFMPTDSASYARYILANSVSPPWLGTSRATSIVAAGGTSR